MKVDNKTNPETKVTPANRKNGADSSRNSYRFHPQSESDSTFSVISSTTATEDTPSKRKTVSSKFPTLGRQSIKHTGKEASSSTSVQSISSSGTRPASKLKQHVKVEVKVTRGDLQPLANLRYIFMQRLLHYDRLEASGITFQKSSVESTYQVFGINGETLFLLEQRRTRCSGFIFYAKHCFANTLFDLNGNELLKFFGPRMILSKIFSKMLIKDETNTTVGYIKIFGSKCNFSVYNANGERLFLVTSGVLSAKEETVFTILSKGNKLGVMRYGWGQVFKTLPYLNYDTAGIEVIEGCNNAAEKALLLGCLMLIEFCFYSPATKRRASIVVILLLAVFLEIFITTIPVTSDNPADFPRTRSFYTGDIIF